MSCVRAKFRKVTNKSQMTMMSEYNLRSSSFICERWQKHSNLCTWHKTYGVAQGIYIAFVSCVCRLKQTSHHNIPGHMIYDALLLFIPLYDNIPFKL